MNDEVSSANNSSVLETAIPPTITPVNDLSAKRDYTIDNYRGFVIFIVFLWCCMFLFFQPGVFSWVKHTDSHGIDIGFGIMDYGILMFVLAAGLIMNVVFEKKVAKGGKAGKLRADYARRGLAVMGVGAIDLVFKMIGDNCIDAPYGWEVFMSIGFASMIAAIFLGRKIWVRILAGAIILIVYAVIAEFIPPVHQSLYASGKLPYGGPFGAIGMAGLLLWFTVLGDYFQSDKKKFAIGVLIMWLLAIPSIVLSFRDCTGTVSNLDINSIGFFGRTFCVSFKHFTLGFLLFGGAFSLLTFLPFWGISALIKKEIPVLATMGKNTIVFFFIFAICNIPAGMIAAAFPDMQALGCLINALMVIAICVPLSLLFKKKNIIIKA